MMKILVQILAIVLTSAQAIEYLSEQRPATRTYSITNEICCNGIIYENVNPSDYECCGSKLIEKETEKCCFPDIYPWYPNIECCGNKSFNSLSHKCVTPIKAFTGNYYLSSSHIQSAILPLDVDILQTCGNKIMNSKEEICCNYQIYADVDRKLQCCGGNILFNPITHVCCGGQVVPKDNPTDKYCCGEKTYNSKKYFCNDDILKEKQTGKDSNCGGNIYNVINDACCSINGSLHVTKRLHPDHNTCCGNVTYNTENARCCRNWVKNDEDEDALYSGIDVEDKSCCGTELIDEGLKCCYDKGYSSETHTCCSQWVKNIGSFKEKLFEVPDGKCCGVEIMDVEKEECCGTTIIPKAPDGRSGCCLHKIADVGTISNNI